MNKKIFKKKLKEKTNCGIQHNGWTCGTCFFSLNKKGKEKLTNADWQALLLYRGDYIKEELSNLPKNPMKSIEKIYKIIG